MSQAIMPKFGSSSKSAMPTRVYTEQELEEAMLIAAWREQRWDVIVELVNAHCGLRLTWHDPLCDSIEEDYE